MNDLWVKIAQMCSCFLVQVYKPAIQRLLAIKNICSKTAENTALSACEPKFVQKNLKKGVDKQVGL